MNFSLYSKKIYLRNLYAVFKQIGFEEGLCYFVPSNISLSKRYTPPKNICGEYDIYKRAVTTINERDLKDFYNGKYDNSFFPVTIKIKKDGSDNVLTHFINSAQPIDLHYYSENVYADSKDAIIRNIKIAFQELALKPLE